MENSVLISENRLKREWLLLYYRVKSIKSIKLVFNFFARSWKKQHCSVSVIWGMLVSSLRGEKARNPVEKALVIVDVLTCC